MQTDGQDSLSRLSLSLSLSLSVISSTRLNLKDKQSRQLPMAAKILYRFLIEHNLHRATVEKERVY